MQKPPNTPKLQPWILEWEAARRKEEMFTSISPTLNNKRVKDTTTLCWRHWRILCLNSEIIDIGLFYTSVRKKQIWIAVKTTSISTRRCISMRTCVSRSHSKPFGCQRTWLWVNNHREAVMIPSEWLNRRSKMVCLNTMCACFVNRHCKAVVFR